MDKIDGVLTNVTDLDLKKKKNKIFEDVEEIGDFAFCDCKLLKEMVVPFGVKKVGNFAFSQCSSLKKITLPSTIYGLGNRIFVGCENLKTVSFAVYIDKKKKNLSVPAEEFYAFNFFSDELDNSNLKNKYSLVQRYVLWKEFQQEETYEKVKIEKPKKEGLGDKIINTFMKK